MEKKIKLVMRGNKSIEIFVNDDLKHIIEESEREISAEMIYRLLDYKIGDNFSVLSENEKNVDAPVLSFFKELFDNISDRINEMNIDDEDIALEIAADSDKK